ncbi:MAG: hypothetical protein Q8R24_05065 [Legionellaceae bacterium]|nr:hypothetical protein [Legionellaceae bacterium]
MFIILFIIGLILFINHLKSWRQFKIWRWQRALCTQKHSKTLQKISADINGFALSRQARAKGDALEYVYGEIDFLSFIALLTLTKPDHNTVFYDLGSGTGKAVFACSMIFPVKKSCGIELFHELHLAARTQLKQLLKLSDYEVVARRIHFIQGNFLQTDFYDATLIFINATGYFGDTWIALNNRLEDLPIGTIVITTTKQLLSSRYTIQRVTAVQMSWGIVRAYIHMKT